MTPEQLDELERLEKAATKGPWWVELSRDEKLPLLKYRWDDVPTWIAEASNRENNSGDFAFIAALRNAFPSLLRLARIGAAAKQIQPMEWEYIFRKLDACTDKSWAISHELRKLRNLASRKGE